MKRIINIIVCIIISILLISCNEQLDHTQDSYYHTDKTNESNMTQDSGATENKPNFDSIAEMEKEETDSNEDYMNQEMPTIISFKTHEEIVDFVSIGNSSELYETFINKTPTAVPLKTVTRIAEKMETIPIPFVKDPSTVDEFGASYYVERDELNLLWIIDNVRYRFVYRYGSSKTYSYDSVPIVENINVLSTSLNLYQGNECFVGSMPYNTASIMIVVYTENSKNIDFSVFEYATILSDTFKNHINSNKTK